MSSQAIKPLPTLFQLHPNPSEGSSSPSAEQQSPSGRFSDITLTSPLSVGFSPFPRPETESPTPFSLGPPADVFVKPTPRTPKRSPGTVKISPPRKRLKLILSIPDKENESACKPGGKLFGLTTKVGEVQSKVFEEALSAKPESLGKGTSGAYRIKNTIFKSDSPKVNQQKFGIATGTMGYREVAGKLVADRLAHILGCESLVPKTDMAEITSPDFMGQKTKTGSIQEFVGVSACAKPPAERVSDLLGINKEDLPKLLADVAKKNPHQIMFLTLFDLMVCNRDRNRGNLLIDPTAHSLYMIDHGCILADNFMSSAVFVWMTWEHIDAIFTPYDETALRAIHQIQFADFKGDILKAMPHFSQEALVTFELSILALKIGAAVGLTPFEIGAFFRYINRGPGDELQGASPINKLVCKARKESGDLAELLKGEMVKLRTFRSERRLIFKDFKAIEQYFIIAGLKRDSQRLKPPVMI